MNIDRIEIGFRYRKDLGDLRSLTESISEVGLPHPVVVTPEGRLIAGQRRLEACRRLGWTDIPSWISCKPRAANRTKTSSARIYCPARSLR